MSPRTILAAAAGLLAASCAELPPLEAGVCGNGVVEAGEDCDLHAPDGERCGAPEEGAGACRFRCDGASCPASWACGGDGVCRHASGAWTEAPGSPFALEAPALGLADVDGDGNPDVVSWAKRSVAVRYGLPQGQLGDGERLAIRSSGLPGLGDLDQDGTSDLVVPTDDGLVVVLGDRDRRLAPVAYSPYDASGFGESVRLVPAETFPILHLSTIVFFWDDPGGQASYGFADEGALLLPGRVADLAGAPAVADVDTDARRAVDPRQASEEIALGFEGDEVAYLYRLALADGTFAARLERPVPIALPGPLFEGVRLADVDGDGDGDLLASVGTRRSDARIAVSLQAADGTFPPAAFDLRFDALRSASCGFEEFDGSGSLFPLAAGELGVGPSADFVLEGGIVFEAFGELCPWMPSGGRLREAAIADFNRDGAPDVALATGSDEALGLLFGEGGVAFTTAIRDVDGLPTHLRPGDFDGDGLADLAMALRHPGEGDVVAVVFGTAGGLPEAPVPMGAFPFVESLETVAAGIDRPDDLMLVTRSSPDGAGARSFGLLLGTADRYLISPLVLSHLDPETQEEVSYPPLAAVVGRFDPSGDDVPDILAIAPPWGWLLPGAGGARFEPSAAVSYPLALEGGFDVTSALAAVVDLDGDGRDEVVAVDGGIRAGGAGGPGHVLTVRGGEVPSLEVGEALDGVEALHDLVVADADADGDPDVLLSFAGKDGAGAAAVVLLTEGGVAGAGGTRRYEPATDAGGVWSAAAGNADADAAPELLVLTARGVHVVELDALRLVAEPTVALAGAGGSLRTADLDADGLDDLLVEARSALTVLLAAPHVDR